MTIFIIFFFFFFQAEDGIRDLTVTGVQTCALPIWIRGAASTAARLADVVRRARPGGGRGMARRADAGRARGDAASGIAARRRPVPRRAAALCAPRLLSLPVQHTRGARPHRGLVVARAHRLSHAPGVARRPLAPPEVISRREPPRRVRLDLVPVAGDEGAGRGG